MSNPQDFFPAPLTPPARPERFPEDYEDDLEEECSVCNEQLGVHTTREIVKCALKELRGENPKVQ